MDRIGCRRRTAPAFDGRAERNEVERSEYRLVDGEVEWGRRGGTVLIERA